MRANAVVLTAVLLLTGCGAGSTATVTEVTTVIAPARSASTTAAGSMTLMPALLQGQESCGADMAGHDAQLYFFSHALNVGPLCQQWITTSARQGFLWQSAVAGGEPNAVPVCVLDDFNGKVTATVIDSGEQIFGQQACTSLIADGWAEQSITTAATS